MKALISVVMGSKSDLSTMQEAVNILREFKVPYEAKVVSAHRMPEDCHNFARRAKQRGIKVIIAGAGGAAALAGVIASLTTLPVVAVPIETRSLKGIDSLLSTVQMPSGVPVACMAIGVSGAKNAAILSLQILSLSDKKIESRLVAFKKKLARKGKR